VNINVADLLNGNYILLLFVVLALGLCLGKLRLGSVQLGNSIGVLVVSLLLGQQHFSINTDALNLGFMLFIFCVGVEAGPNFFSIFFRDGKNYLMLALVMVGSALVIALGLGKLFGWDIGLTAGMLAGSMTSTPVLVGAGDTLRHSGMAGAQLSTALDHLSLGYALTYLIGLVSLIVGARYLPKLQHQDLQTSAQQIARERGLGPLAEAIWANRAADPAKLGEAYVQGEVADVKAALEGARDIVAETMTENADLLGRLRDYMRQNAIFRAKVVDGKQAAGEKFSDYFDHFERWATVPGHRALAMLRGRTYALPEDMSDLVPDVLRHRVTLSYEGLSEGLTPDALVERIMRAVPAPPRPLEHERQAA